MDGLENHSEAIVKRHPCEKCGSADVHYGTPWSASGYVPTKFMWRAERLTFFVCCTCGHVELSVDGEADRKQIAEDWPRIETD